MGSCRHGPLPGGPPLPQERAKTWCHHDSPVHAGSPVLGRREAQLDGFLVVFFFFLNIVIFVSPYKSPHPVCLAEGGFMGAGVAAARGTLFLGTDLV